jgi:hypothetical protein
MMTAVMVAPVDPVVTRGAMMASDARAMHGHHPAAASSTDKDRDGIDGGIVVIIGVIIRIVVRVIVVIDAADKEAMPMPKTVMETATEPMANEVGTTCKPAEACAAR